jgi:hypothetical protein
MSNAERRTSGLCLSWRSALPACPPPACAEGSHYEECGPGCDVTCLGQAGDCLRQRELKRSRGQCLIVFLFF